VAGGEDVAVGGLLEDPGAAGVAGAVQVGGRARPVQVHVHGDRGRGRVVREAPLEQADLVEAEPRPAELGRDRDVQVARGAQLLEVLVEEAVLAVVQRGPLVEAGEHLVREDGCGANRGGHAFLLHSG
jgi:hypothetical protein